MKKKLCWLAVVVFLLLSTQAFAAAVVESYSDEARTIPEDTFTVYGNPVYMRATGVLNGKEYRFDYLDADSTPLMSDQKVAVGTTIDSLIVPSDYPSAKALVWTCLIYRVSNGVLQDTDTFTVQASAIPEFPTALSGAVVAGICFGIFYYWRRKRSVKA